MCALCWSLWHTAQVEIKEITAKCQNKRRTESYKEKLFHLGTINRTAVFPWRWGGVWHGHMSPINVFPRLGQMFRFALMVSAAAGQICIANVTQWVVRLLCVLPPPSAIKLFFCPKVSLRCTNRTPWMLFRAAGVTGALFPAGEWLKNKTHSSVEASVYSLENEGAFRTFSSLLEFVR